MTLTEHGRSYIFYPASRAPSLSPFHPPILQEQKFDNHLHHQSNIHPNMVNLKSVRESNAALRSTRSGQVSLFVGATSGIALHTLTEYTRHADRPKVYIVGRSDTKLSTVIGDLERINPQGSYVPIRSEVSLLKNVDTACEEYKRKEKCLDLLIMAPGYLKLSRIGTHFSVSS
jgi:hypothetical protein